MVVYADEKELAKRINRVGFEDIMDMEYNTIFWLIHRFTSEYLVRLLCSRGENKWEMGEILSLLKKVHKEYYDQPSADNNPLDKLYQHEEPEYFFHIAFDIETNYPLLPDEESPLPTSPEGEELGLGMGLLETRIAELEKENEALRQQLAPEEHCEEEEEDHFPEEGVLRNKVSFECFLQLLEQAGCDLNNTGNKTRAGALWHMMTGKSAHDLRRYCSGRDYNNNHTKTDIARLDTLLSDLGITSLKLRQ